MFTQECFIKKDTPELHRKLEKLGYHKFECCRDKFEKGDVLSVVEMDNGEPVYTYIYHENIKDLGYIDCGTNEDMFLALAALRDDSDKNQWFVPDYEEYENEWFFCDEDKIENTFLCYDCMFGDFHKATVEEIVKHFKNKEYE